MAIGICPICGRSQTTTDIAGRVISVGACPSESLVDIYKCLKIGYDRLLRQLAAKEILYCAAKDEVERLQEDLNEMRSKKI